MHRRIVGKPEAFLGQAKESPFQLAAAVLVVKGLRRVCAGGYAGNHDNDVAGNRRRASVPAAAILQKLGARADRHQNAAFVIAHTANRHAHVRRNGLARQR